MNDPDTAALTAEIVSLQKELTEGKKKLNDLRMKLPPGEIKEYTFSGPDGAATTLAALFGDRTDLIMIHNMGRSCPYCTLWADGLNGLVDHFTNRAAFVVVSPDPPEVQREFAASRGWKFDMWSWHGSSFGVDMQMAEDESKPWPGVSVFQKKSDGRIVRTGFDYFGPGDYYCSIWHIMDLFPEGANDWQPKYTYDK